MAELSELNSLNVDPTRIIDWNDVASFGLCDTEWFLETTSSCGEMVFVRKTMPSQIKTIGSARRWIIRGRNGGIRGWSTRGAGPAGSLPRVCSGNKRKTL